MVTPPNNEPISLLKEFLGLITRSFWLKFLSLLFAIVLFFIVRTDKEVVYERMAKVKIVTMPNMTVIGQSERFLNVSIRVQNSLFSGPPSDSELTGEVVLSTSTPEKMQIKVTRDHFLNLPKYDTIFIERPYIEVEVDKVAEKVLPIQVILKGEPATGLMISKVTVKPDQIKVSGAKQELNKLDTLSTVPINVDGMSKNFTTLVPLDIGDRNSIKLPQPSVQVVVELGEKKFNRVFREVPVEIYGLANNQKQKVELRPKYIDIEISGEKALIHKINPSEIRAYINGSDLLPGWQDKKITLKIPENVSLVKMNPDTLSVNFKSDDN